MEYTAIVLMIMLGLRHGFDADHIAIIDGISVRYTESRPQLSKWTGTLFALGHGSIVTAIAVVLANVSHTFSFNPVMRNLLDWFPGILLIIVGIINWRMLDSPKHYHPKGWKLFFLPSRLKNNSHPLAIILTGMLFALVFDSSTQAAAWAYTATTRLTTTSALILGVSFTAGMIATDTLNSRVLFSLMLKHPGNHAATSYRRKIGWIIVWMSLLVGSYKIITNIIPGAELPDRVVSGLGVAFFLMIIIFYAFLLSPAFKNKNRQHGN